MRNFVLDKLIIHIMEPWIWIVPGAPLPPREYWMCEPVGPPPPDLEKPIESRRLVGTEMGPRWEAWKTLPCPIALGDAFYVGADRPVNLGTEETHLLETDDNVLAVQIKYSRRQYA